MRLRGLAAAAGAAVLALVLAGCGDDEPATGTVGGGDDPPATTEPEPEPGDDGNGADDTGGPDEDGSDPPKLPDEKLPEPEKGDREAAVAFLERYLEEQNKATSSGDFSTVESMITESCQLCTDSVERISGYHADGYTVENGQFEDPKINVDVNAGGVVALTVVTDVAPMRVLDDGNEVESYPAESDLTISYGLEKDDQGNWNIIAGEVVQ